MKISAFHRFRKQMPALCQHASRIKPSFMGQGLLQHCGSIYSHQSLPPQAQRRRFQAASDLVVLSALGSHTKRRVRHILFPQDKQDSVPEIQAQLEAGGSFEELARENSSCVSAKRGGDLGWVQRGMGLPDALEHAIFEADVEEIFSADSRHGVHILQVLDEKDVAQMQDMSVADLAKLLQEGPETAQFIDVREPAEHNIARLPHFELLPLSRMQEWGSTLRGRYDIDKETICLCHAGMRSRQFASMLLEEGFTKVYNVTGGIDAYSCLIDEKVSRY